MSMLDVLKISGFKRLWLGQLVSIPGWFSGCLRRAAGTTFQTL